jgi:hypothetical protein
MTRRRMDCERTQPKPKAFYCVHFQDWGRHRVGTPEPRVEHRPFDTREDAEAFRSELRARLGSECLSTIIEVAHE